MAGKDIYKFFKDCAEMITLNVPSSKDFLNLAGKPNGLSKEETQMLVSITALTATFCFSYFFYGLGNIGFDLFRRKLCSLFVYLFYDLIKTFLPLIMSEYFYRNLFMLLYINILQGFKYSVFKDSINNFSHCELTFLFTMNFTIIREKERMNYE
jgi:hypothetical protein